MNVIGLDVSLTSTGWACLDYDSGDLVDCGTIATNPADNLTHRIATIYAAVRDIIGRHEGCDVAIEEGVAHRSGTTTRVLAMAWAAAALAVVHASTIEPAEINIGTVKRTATGMGNADKKLVTAAAVARWGQKCHQLDIADAAWVAECGRLRLIEQWETS